MINSTEDRSQLMEQKVAAQFISIALIAKNLGRPPWKTKYSSRTELVEEENSWIKLTGTEKLKLPGGT